MGITGGNSLGKVLDRIFQRSGKVLTDDLRKRKCELKDIKANFKVDVKFNDFRDWFVMEKDKDRFNKVHKTEMSVYVEDMFAATHMIPINFKKVTVKLTFSVTRPIKLTKFRWLIPEMGTDRTSTFVPPKMVDPGDTINFNCDLTMDL